MTTLSCSLKAQLWKKSEEKAHVIILRSLRTLSGAFDEKEEQALKCSSKALIPCSSFVILGWGQVTFPMWSHFLYRQKTAGIPDLRAWRQGLSQTPKPHPPRLPTSIFFSSQCLSSLPPMPTTLAWVSQLSPRCGIVWKDIWSPGAAESPSQGEAIVHSSGLSDILYARITLD